MFCPLKILKLPRTWLAGKSSLSRMGSIIFWEDLIHASRKGIFRV